MKSHYLACLLLVFVGCVSTSDPGTPYRETAVKIQFDKLPTPVIDAINSTANFPPIDKVKKWGSFPYEWFEIEFDNQDSKNFGPDGSIRLRSRGGII